MSFARGLSIKFAALWNGQKVFRNTSGRHTKNFQERYIKVKFNCNVLFTCLILRKIYKFKKIYSLFFCWFCKLKKLQLDCCCVVVTLLKLALRWSTCISVVRADRVSTLVGAGTWSACCSFHTRVVLEVHWLYYPRFGANIFFRCTLEAALCLLGRKMCIRAVSELARAPQSATLLL